MEVVNSRIPELALVAIQKRTRTSLKMPESIPIFMFLLKRLTNGKAGDGACMNLHHFCLNKLIMRKIIVIIAVFAWFVAGQSFAQQPSPVKVQEGMVQGTIENGLTVYKGIPFAAP